VTTPRLAGLVRLRHLAGALLLLGFAVVATGFQVGDYPFEQREKPRGGRPREERRFYQELSDKEIRAVMKDMAAQLGVDCNYCHNTKDYKSFENPMKEFAQVKISMVNWLNAKYRPVDATWNYSCFTCHRGTVKPLPQAAPPTPLPSPKRPTLNEGRGSKTP
jgi:hypothetical protein